MNRHESKHDIDHRFCYCHVQSLRLKQDYCCARAEELHTALFVLDEKYDCFQLYQSTYRYKKKTFNFRFE